MPGNNPGLTPDAFGNVDPRQKALLEQVPGRIKSGDPRLSANAMADARNALQRRSDFYDNSSASAARPGQQASLDALTAAAYAPSSMAALQGQQAQSGIINQLASGRGAAGFQSDIGAGAAASGGVAGDVGRGRLAEFYGNLDAAAAGQTKMREQDLQQYKDFMGADVRQAQRNLERYKNSMQVSAGAAESNRQAQLEGMRIGAQTFSDSGKLALERNNRAFDMLGTAIKSVIGFV